MEPEICPHCGAVNRLSRTTCWLCGHSPVATGAAAEPQPQASPTEKTAQRTFGLSSLMLLIALIAVCLGVMRELPGLGIALAVVATPALIRTIGAVGRKEARGRPMDVPEIIGTFLGSVAVVTTIAVAAGAAFVATCFPVGLVTLGPDRGWGVGIVGIVFAFVLGFAVAGFVGYFLIRRLWPRKE